MKKQRIVCIVGPTATGKTALSVELAKRMNGEIVSADSMQLYRGMHIASAAPDESEKQGIAHHLIEFLPPDAHYCAADYLIAARREIAGIHERGHLPVIVGGTGLYISALTENICFAEEPSDPALRAKLNAELERDGAEELLRRLAAVDPQTAERLHPNNSRRIVRALEVYLSTGKTMSEAQKLSRQYESPYDPCMIGLTFRDRERLYERIDRRVNEMVNAGLIEEARQTMSLPQNATAVQAIGHKELYPFLKGEISSEEAIENLKRATRRYAKRQLTWFRRDERIRWIYRDETPDVLQSALEILNEKEE